MPRNCGDCDNYDTCRSFAKNAQYIAICENFEDKDGLRCKTCKEYDTCCVSVKKYVGLCQSYNPKEEYFIIN